MFNICMKEFDFLNIINNTLSSNDLLGEDCAFLSDLNIFITQDTLVEGIHFDTNYTDFFLLAKKSIAVNLSDLAANLALPKYISISLSLPDSFSSESMKDFYRGVQFCCDKYNIKVSGGDITGSFNKICISICAIGVPVSKTISSRKFAKENQVVCVTKNYGSSAYGLYCLANNVNCNPDFINSHLDPNPDIYASKKLANLGYDQIAIIDSSDGLVDSLYRIAKASNKSININFSDIPFDDEIKSYNGDYKDLVLWGGEDYGLVFCIDKQDYAKISDFAYIIGMVRPHSSNYIVKVDDFLIDEKIYLNKCYNHFKKDCL